MDKNHTRKSTRIIIWVIALVMAIGFVGSYFLLILQNNDANSATQTNSQSTNQNTTPDPTAYRVSGKVASLQTADLTVGTGAEAKAGDLVTVHYKGTLAQSGVKFDSSYDKGEPITCKLTDFIPGWQQGIPGMKVGGKRRLVIPSSLAYGANAQSSIPANSDLVFEVELLAVNPANATNQCEQSQ